VNDGYGSDGVGKWKALSLSNLGRGLEAHRDRLPYASAPG
jgi:hypothetical protein